MSKSVKSVGAVQAEASQAASESHHLHREGADLALDMPARTRRALSADEVEAVERVLDFMLTRLYSAHRLTIAAVDGAVDDDAAGIVEGAQALIEQTMGLIDDTMHALGGRRPLPPEFPTSPVPAKALQLLAGGRS
jgi:hypothetical protein